MTDDFKDHPKTINEHKAAKSEKSEDWRLRDALIAALREIDSGEYKGDVYGVIIIGVFNETGQYTRVKCAARNHYEAIGLFEVGKHIMVKE